MADAPTRRKSATSGNVGLPTRAPDEASPAFSLRPRHKIREIENLGIRDRLRHLRHRGVIPGPRIALGPGEGSDGLKRIEGGAAALDRQTGIRVQRPTVLL